MALAGFAHSCRQRPGGVASIRLMEAADLVDAVYDPVWGGFTSLKSVEPFVAYRFREDEAVYTEHISSDGGRLSVTHRLSFVLPGMDGEAQRTVAQLAEVSESGIVAVVTMQEGASLLVGYSRRFGSERPLALASATATTGRSPTEAPGQTVVLVSRDTAKSLPCTMSIL